MDMSLVLRKQPLPCENMMDDSNSKEGPITNFYDDCLLKIFSYLTKKELIGVERVCKKWQYLSQMCWKRVKSLNLEDEFDLKWGPANETECIRKVLLRCGDNLSSLDISRWPHKLMFLKGGKMLSDFMTRINGLSRVEQDLEEVPTEFITACKNLKSLEISLAYDMSDDLLMPLLDSAANLERFVAKCSAFITGESLLHLNKNVKELKLVCMEHFDPENLTNLVSGLSNLEVLELSIMPTFKSTLQKLRLTNQNNGPLFPSLRVLNLSENNFIDNHTLTWIIQSCPNIEELDISGESKVDGEPILFGVADNINNKITDAGVKKLTKLRKLKSLRVNYQKKITSKSLKFLGQKLNTRLEVLGCRGCPSITDIGAGRIVILCPNLTELDVAFCEKVNIEKMVKSAAFTLNMRTNDVSLTLLVTGVTDAEIRKDKLLVKLCPVPDDDEDEFEDADSDDSDFDRAELLWLCNDFLDDANDDYDDEGDEGDDDGFDGFDVMTFFALVLRSQLVGGDDDDDDDDDDDEV